MKTQFIAIAGCFAMQAYAQQTIYSASGFGTYYYDVVETESTCGDDFTSINSGLVECGWYTGRTLDQIGSDYVVAMNRTQLVQDMTLYCGKQVVVYVDGVQSDLQLFIGDGCERCATGSDSSTVWDSNGAPGLDFSFTVFNELTGGDGCKGVQEITWEIVDVTLYDFDADTAEVPLIEVCSGGGPGEGECQSAVVNAEANGPDQGGLCNSWPFDFGNGWFTSNVWCQFWTEPGCTGTGSAWFDETVSLDNSWFYSTESFTCGSYVYST